MAEILRFDASRLVQEVVEDAVLVIDIAAGHCFALDGGAAALWPSLVAGTTRAQLLAEAEATFDAPAETVRPAVEAFVSELLAAGVLVEAAGTATVRQPPRKRLFEPPRMKRYDDLAEVMRDGEEDET